MNFVTTLTRQRLNNVPRLALLLTAELQAIDRTHRLGQTRVIKAIRLVAKNTVEERILDLQEKKRLVFDGVVGGEKESLGRLGKGDLEQLFR